MALFSPRVDFVFKKLFGSEENKDILISFINAVVSQDDQIVEITLLSPFNERERANDKLTVLDVKAVDEKGRQYNIEMQIVDQDSYTRRALYYWSRLYSSQLQPGFYFDKLKKTIGINVLNFNCFDEEPHYHQMFKVLHTESKRSYFNDFEIHFIELQKFNEDIMPLKITLDRWIKFLKTAPLYNKKNFPKELSQEPAIEKAFGCLNTLSMDEEEEIIYEGRLKWLRDEAAALETAERKGLARGLEKGIKKGLEQGMEKGMEKGREEGRQEEQLLIAQKLLSRHFSIAQIKEMTDLSEKTLEKLDKDKQR